MKLRTFFVDPDFWRALRHIAVEQNRSVGAIVREALEQWVAQRSA